MNKHLIQKYALFNEKVSNKTTGFTDLLRSFMKSNLIQMAAFAAVLMVVQSLCEQGILSRYWITSLATTFSMSIAAVGFCLLMGYSGLASLGTGGFIGIGCYSIHFVFEESGLPFFAALGVAIGVAVVIGVIVGFISLRIEGIYLVILTLAISEILKKVYVAIRPKVPSVDLVIAGFEFEKKTFVYFIIVVLAVIMLITANLIKSPTGRAMLAMKNSTAAAQAMGIGLLKYRLMAFVLCTAYAAIAGAMLTLVITTDASAANGYFAVITSLNILAAVIIGGYKSIFGSVAGCFIMYALDTVVLQKVELFTQYPDIIPFISGILVILIVMFYPGGLAQLVVELKGKIKVLWKKLREARYGKDLG